MTKDRELVTQRTDNPYAVSVSVGSDGAPRKRALRSRCTWPIWAAIVWTLLLFVLTPAIAYNRQEPLERVLLDIYKATTALISVLAAILLLWFTDGRWRLASVPVLLSMLFVQWGALRKAGDATVRQPPSDAAKEQVVEYPSKGSP